MEYPVVLQLHQFNSINGVDCLKYPQNRVINSYYFEDKSMKDIGAEMGISGQRISQILHKGLRCLRGSKPLLQLYRAKQQIVGLRRITTLSAAASALMVSIPKLGIQSTRT